MPDYSGIDLLAKSKIVGHLFDVEIAVLETTADAALNDTTVYVNNIGKCWQGTTESDSMILGMIMPDSTVSYVKVKTINYLSNSITLYSGLPRAIVKGTKLFESLTTDSTPLSAQHQDATRVSLGGYDGYLHFTDLDLPVMTVINDVITTYMPFPIEYNEVGMNTTGKVADVSITMANIDQLISGFVLLRAGLRKNRNVRIHTCHLDDDCYFIRHINIPTLYGGNNYFICKIGVDYSLDTLLNRVLNYVYILPGNIVTEFVGLTKTVSMTDKTAIFTVMNNIDDDSDMIVPRATFTRTRCRFLFKGDKCRFRSRATVATAIDNVTTELAIRTTFDKPYLYWEMSESEMAIRIDEEVMRIKKAQAITKARSADSSAFTFYYTIIERGASGTTAAAHAKDAIIDVVYCKKTEADCIARCNYANFGTFPAIPKNTGESSGTIS